MCSAHDITSVNNSSLKVSIHSTRHVNEFTTMICNKEDEQHVLFILKEKNNNKNQHDSVIVESGVPQGTVLGPVLFFAFINDLPKAVKSNVRLFADDSVVYRQVKSDSDYSILQDDLDNLENWENKWCMSFNAAKCNTIAITRKQENTVPLYPT